jgi:uncharacterized protein YndB with AHSA1/START domain
MFVTEFHGTETVHLDVPAAEVFDLLVDVDRLPDWNEHVHHVIEQPDGPLTEGVEWVIQLRAMGTRWPCRSRALTVDRSRLLFEHRSCSDDGNPSYVLWSWQLTPTPDGSMLTVTWTAHPATWRPVLADEVQASLAGLGDHLHAHRQPGSTENSLPSGSDSLTEPTLP